MRNYRTTLVGAALAALSFLAIYQSNGGDLANWQQWLIPVAVAALGYVAKDAGVTGSVKIIIALFCLLSLLSLPSCKAFEDRAGMDALDLIMITANAANRAKADYDATKLDLAAAKIRYAYRRPVTSAKEPSMKSRR